VAELQGLTDEEISNRIKLFENNMRAMKSEEKRIAHDQRIYE
jgi:hypothetical protein